MKRQGDIENGVLIGADGHLFLVGGGHSIFEYASGKRQPTAASISRFHENLSMRIRWSAPRTASYMHIVFPDKQSVLPSVFPHARPICLGETYLESMDSAARSKYLFYPLELLRDHQAACFLKTDTHLSDDGALLIAKEVTMRLVDLNLTEHFLRLEGFFGSEIEHSGDLGAKLDPKMTSMERFLECKWPARFYSNAYSGNNGLVDIWSNDHAITNKRVVLFGDSFGRGLSRILSYFFVDVIFMRTPFYHVDLVDQIAPDFVITENVERYLSNVISDQDRPSFHMYPYMNSSSYQYSPKPEFAEAFSAMLGYKRTPYRYFKANARENRAGKSNMNSSDN